MTELTAIFVYQRDDEIKVRYADDAIILEEDTEWTHIGTLEPRAYIQHLLTDFPDLVRSMKNES